MENIWLAAAISSIFTLAIREFIGVLKIGAEHEFELKRRFFDRRFEMTVEVIKEFKTSTAKMKQMFEILSRTLDPANPLHPSILQSAVKSHEESIKKINEESNNMFYTLRFFYDPELLSPILTDTVLENKYLASISKIMSNADSIRIIENLKKELNVDQKAADKLISSTLEEVRQEAKITLDLMNQIDAAVDITIDRVGKTFDRYRS